MAIIIYTSTERWLYMFWVDVIANIQRSMTYL